MASVAKALATAGVSVSGSDSGVYPPMSEELSRAGILYHTIFDARHTETAIDSGMQPLFIIGNALSRGNPEVEDILNRRLPFTSLAAFVGDCFIGKRTSVVVAGTHGKTTTTALTAWILHHAGYAPGFLAGGVPQNFDSGCTTGDGDIFVIEGDEYDTAFFDKRSKFVHYKPTIAIINNIEFDHADIFDSLDAVKKAFRQLVNLVPGNGCIIVNGDDGNAMDVVRDAHSSLVTIGFGSENDWHALDIEHSNEGTTFLARSASITRQMHLPLIGEYNVRNALAAIAACDRLGLSLDEVQRGFSTFEGVKRRLEVIAEVHGVTVIDDFAHHPTAVRGTLLALRKKYPSRTLWVLFEPRSNTTTRNIFQDEFADALSHADVILIGALNRPERYAEEERLSVEQLCGSLRAKGLTAEHIPDADEMVERVVSHVREGDVVVFLSNGNFGGARQKLVRLLQA